MKAVFAARAHFDAIELYGIVGVQMKIEALEKEGGIHAIGGSQGACYGGIVPVLEAEDARRAAYGLYGATCTVDGIGIGRFEKHEGEGEDTGSGGDSHLFRYAAVCDGVGVIDAG